MTIRDFITGIVMGLVIAAIVVGGLFLWYVIGEIALCQKYEQANPDTNFDFEFSTGCTFELPDGTWINLREYRNQSQYKLEI